MFYTNPGQAGISDIGYLIVDFEAGMANIYRGTTRSFVHPLALLVGADCALKMRQRFEDYTKIMITLRILAAIA